MKVNRDSIRFIKALGCASVVTISALTAIRVASAAPDAGTSRLLEDRRNFVACPIVQDTNDTPCWLAEYNGETYFLGIQSDSQSWMSPTLGRKVLVEGKVAGLPRICGGIPLTVAIKRPTPIMATGTVNGQPLPEPPITSNMSEPEPSCSKTILPAQDFGTVSRHGPGPMRLDPSAGGKYAAKTPPPPSPPYQTKVFTMAYDFNDELPDQSHQEVWVAQEALRYAVDTQAKRIEIVGHAGATLLSSGETISEIPEIAQRRAEAIANVLDRIGLPSGVVVDVKWQDKPAPADGTNDPLKRITEIIVTP